jgi:methionine synthase II (cobalamin-independent)
LIDKPETIVDYANQIIDRINPNGLALVPNRPLELVPQQIAIKKVESLAKAKGLLQNE